MIKIYVKQSIKARSAYYERKADKTDCDPNMEVFDRDICLNCTNKKCKGDCERAKQAREQAKKQNSKHGKHTPNPKKARTL